jgi:hypothetical protein
MGLASGEWKEVYVLKEGTLSWVAKVLGESWSESTTTIKTTKARSKGAEIESISNSHSF